MPAPRVSSATPSRWSHPDIASSGEGQRGAAWRFRELIEGAPAIPRRFEALLVGRDRELRSSCGRRSRTHAASCRCRLIVLAGEPGIGKTRLAREFLSQLDGKATVFVGRCVSYGTGRDLAAARRDPSRRRRGITGEPLPPPLGGAGWRTDSAPHCGHNRLVRGGRAARGSDLGLPPSVRDAGEPQATRPRLRGCPLGRADAAGRDRAARRAGIGADPRPVPNPIRAPRAAGSLETARTHPRASSRGRPRPPRRLAARDSRLSHARPRGRGCRGEPALRRAAGRLRRGGGSPQPRSGPRPQSKRFWQAASTYSRPKNASSCSQRR